MENTNLIKCPQCGSTQITANKKGFSGKKAVAGAILTGGVGLLAGTIGSNKVRITCLACGHEWRPGQDKPIVTPKSGAEIRKEIEEEKRISLNNDKFMNLYNQGKKDEAFAILDPLDPNYSKYTDVDTAFRIIKAKHNNNLAGCLVILIIVIGLLIYFNK